MERYGIIADKEQWDKLLERIEEKRYDARRMIVCAVKLVTIKQNDEDHRIKKVQTKLKNYTVIAYSPDQNHAMIMVPEGSK